MVAIRYFAIGLELQMRLRRIYKKDSLKWQFIKQEYSCFQQSRWQIGLRRLLEEYFGKLSQSFLLT